MTVEKVKSLGGFTERVREIRRDWSMPAEKELWFRGEKRDYGETRLRPILYRPPKDRSLKAIPDLLRIEDDLFKLFQRCNSQLSLDAIGDDFDGYLFMQHHGGPTRLLDWSDGSIMALHFALRNKQSYKSDSVVFVLDPYRLMDKLDALPEAQLRDKEWAAHTGQTEDGRKDPDADDVSFMYLPSSDGTPRPLNLPRLPLVLDFPFISRRVAAQRSQFIVLGSEPSWLSDEAAKPDGAIRQIVIEGEYTKAIRAELRECGVTESVIFPDLDGLGRELDQLWQDRQ
jgi:hypothetical protein